MGIGIVWLVFVAQAHDAVQGAVYNQVIACGCGTVQACEE